tara:strand:+ start:2403 stop:3257 length:855 start_codon:yes stop_codon:yes gene_type:complete
MARCLVTGHLGYIGSKVYKELINQGHEVYGVDLKHNTDIRYDLFDFDKLCRNVSFVPEYIFHLAAMPSVQWCVENPSEAMSHNVLGSSRVLEYAKINNVKRVIFASSAAAKNPVSPYGLHKLYTEGECKLYARLYDIDTVCLRFFNVYSEDQEANGPYSTVISAWLNGIKNNSNLFIDGDGKQTRDFIHVDDIVSANIFCMNYGKNFGGNNFDVATGFSHSLNYIKTLFDEHYKIDWIHRVSRVGDIKFSSSESGALRRLGWSASVNIEDGLKRCFNYLENNNE